MKIETKLFLAAAFIVMIIVLLNYMGLLAGLNEPINKLARGEPNFDCRTNEDCTYGKISCSRWTCGGVPINSAWHPFCPFNNERRIIPEEPIPDCANKSPLSFKAECKEGKCQEVFHPENQ